LNLLSAVLDMVNVYKDADPYRLMKKADLRQLAPNLLTPSKTAKAPKADEFISSLFPHVTKLVCGLEDSGLSSGLFAALLVRQPGRPYHHQQAAREAGAPAFLERLEFDAQVEASSLPRHHRH